MRLKWFCSHDYEPCGTNRGENLLGLTTHSVDFRCRRCLKVKHDIGYISEEHAQRALAHYKRVML